ncbi:hypothetical protein GCM10011409_19280 [Lentibacillus populi]|uniref:SIR2-like domain-containing protein n=1 Tax=Lentibacillus populi TaxID=1827502 RepID=A0A9W5TWZ5_9BACI|nr:SIR2 family protein [Lentibacillus populi]GGB41882.1 hypothetical protein GCM10011409_19280 [Lentibacillus populi]
MLSEYSLNEEMNYEIELFKRLRDKMLTVITTNYDTLFEDYIFTEHDKIVGQDIFKNSELGTLFKIHGCITNPSSLVLTSKDYQKFKKKRKVLSAKLINLFTENPVIFMGYSVSDENIRSILLDIFQCIDEVEDYKVFEKRLIMIEYSENQEIPSIGTYAMSIDNVEITFTKVVTSSFTPILEEMQKLKKKVRFKDLKHIKDIVYDIVQNDNGQKKKFINLVDNETAIDDDEIVVAITKKDNFLDSVGITGIQPEDLFDDLLTGSLENKIRTNERQKLLIEIQIPNLLRGNNILPIHKYIKNYNGELTLESKVNRLCNMKVDDFFNNSIKRDIDSYYENHFSSLEEIFETIPSNSRKLSYLVIRCVYDSEPGEIRQFLLSYGNKIYGMTSGGTHYRKMACIYDIKKYKNAQ